MTNGKLSISVVADGAWPSASDLEASHMRTAYGPVQYSKDSRFQFGVLEMDVGPDAPHSKEADAFVRDAFQGRASVGGALLQVDTITMSVEPPPKVTC